MEDLLIKEDADLQKEVEELEKDINDPGELEGAKKDPLIEQHNIDETNPRFQKIYGKFKHTEREVQSLKEEREKDRKLIEEMKRWNAELTDSIKESNESVVEAIRGKQAEETDTIQEEIEALKREIVKAGEDLEHERQADLIEKLADKKLEFKEAQKRKAELPKKEDRVSNADLQPFQDFIDNTPWYNEDPEMAMEARNIDMLLSSHAKWATKPIEERLAEVRRRVERKYPDWQDELGITESRDKVDKPVFSGVESGKKGGNPSKGISSLSKTELELASGLGISPDTFLKQKSMLKRGNK